MIIIKMNYYVYNAFAGTLEGIWKAREMPGADGGIRNVRMPK